MAVLSTGDKGDKGDTGESGYSPAASVEQTDTGATITITDINGTTTADVNNGIDGTDGVDGYSPTATVSKSGTVTTITITDKDGTTTAEVYDGTGGGAVDDVEVNGVSVVSGGVASVTVPTDVSDLNNDSGYITSSALSGYATETWVGNQGYLTSVPTATTSSLGLVQPDGTTITVNNGVISSSGGESSRNIGEIVASTIPLTDAGLHLLDGSQLQYGSYQDFIDYIATLYNSGNYTSIFDTEVNWQSAVSTYGVCGKFVYDSVNNTVRLPKITGIVEGTTDPTALGNLIQAGLPNITGAWGEALNNAGDTYNTTNSALYYEKTQSNVASTGNARQLGVIRFDASRNNSIYGNSSKVQPQAIKALYYIVIATSTKTQIEVDIDEIATDLNGKADVDLTNVNNTGKQKSINWVFPSTTKEGLTLGATGTQYTAPADGWYHFAKYSTAANQIIVLTTSGLSSNNISVQSNNALRVFLPAKKGEKVTVYYTAAGNTIDFDFYYAIGEA